MIDSRILVAGHEWGGLNLLAPLLRAWVKSNQFAVTFVGATKVMRELSLRVPGLILAPESDILSDGVVEDVHLLDTLAAQLLGRTRYDLLLCGTSLHTSLERRLILAARAAGVPSISFCDMSWALADRFRCGDAWAVPDWLWMTNQQSCAAATAVAWPEQISIEVIGNPHLGELAQQQRPFAAAGRKIRFLSEPVSAVFPNVGLNEFDLAATFVAAVREAGLDAPIIIRPHPIESEGRWNDWIAGHASKNVSIDTLPVTEAIEDTRMAVGICSILLAEMSVSGVPAAALQPKDADPSYFCVPFEDYGVAQVGDRQALLTWLKSSRSREPTILDVRDLQAIETATWRLQGIIDETRTNRGLHQPRAVS